MIRRHHERKSRPFQSGIRPFFLLGFLKEIVGGKFDQEEKNNSNGQKIIKNQILPVQGGYEGGDH